MKNKILNSIKKTDLSIQKRFLKPRHERLEHVDVVLKWAPLVSLIVLDLLDNKKRKEKLEKHLIDAAAAELLLNAAVLPLKHIFRRRRPNGDLKSFPSNHTANSFLGSEMLRRELQDQHPALSYSGYAISISTAILRMYHNKHWFSDVLTGAVLGILSVELSPKLVDKIIYSTSIQAAV